MQNCGQLQASIAVALIAQSDGELWPTDMQSRAAIGRNNILRITVPPSSAQLCAGKSSDASSYPACFFANRTLKTAVMAAMPAKKITSVETCPLETFPARNRM